MRRNKQWGAMGSLLALLVFACFSYPFSLLPFLIIFVFLLSTNAAQWNANDANWADQDGFFKLFSKRIIRVNPRHLRSIITLSGLVITCFCGYKQYPVYQAYKQWNQNRVYYHAGMYNESVQNYESLYPYLNDQIQFLFEYAQSLSKSDFQGMADQARHDRLVRSNEVLARAMQISCDPMLYNIMGKKLSGDERLRAGRSLFGQIYPDSSQSFVSLVSLMQTV
jgi:hypothetical protein